MSKQAKKRENFLKSDNPASTKGDTLYDPIASQEVGEERVLTQRDIDVMYNDYSFAKRIINDIASSALKSGFEINSGNKELDEKVMKRFKNLECADYVTRLLEMGLKDGIAFLFPVLEGLPLETGSPLDLKKIRKIKDFNIFQARDIVTIERQMDKMQEQYGACKTIQFKNEYGVVPVAKIDCSWLTGYEPYPRPEKYTTNSIRHGDSFYKRIWDILTIKDSGIWSAGQLAYAALLKILKLGDKKELSKQIKEIGKKKYQKKREMEMNTTTLLLLGKDDEFETADFSKGIDLDKLKNYIYTEISIDTGIPLSRLTGSAQGALASAKEDSKKWYEYIEKFQTDNLDEMLRNVLKLLYAEQGQYDIEFELKFNSIRSVDEKEKAEIEKLEAEAKKTIVETLLALEKSIKGIEVDRNILDELKNNLLSQLGLGE